MLEVARVGSILRPDLAFEVVQCVGGQCRAIALQLALLLVQRARLAAGKCCARACGWRA